MAIVDDDMKEDSVYAVLDFLNSNLSEETPSLEDIAWADSFLNKDVDAFDNDWSSIKDALLEILNSQPGPVDSPAAKSSAHRTADEILHSRENVINLEFARGSDEDEVLTSDDVGEADDDEDDLVFGNRKGWLKGKSQIRSVFFPNYSDVKAEDIDSGLDLTIYGVEPCSSDIFRVWDLGTSDEQDDFTKQLNKAFGEAPSLIESNYDDSTAWKDPMHVSVDDLVAGMGDLSLKQTTK